jgi:hypothetical protein
LFCQLTALVHAGQKSDALCQGHQGFGASRMIYIGKGERLAR